MRPERRKAHPGGSAIDSRFQTAARIQSAAAAHGWFNLPHYALRSIRRKFRDRLWGRRLRAPGFRAARSPRILGASALHLGPDFHARDFLWLEAVTAYTAAGETSRFQPEIRIGPSARLSDNVHIACIDRITIGANLLCGSGVLISDHAHGSYRGANASDPSMPPAERPLVSAGPVVIGNNVWLGDCVAVLAGASVGDGCIIGAHSVVTRDIPPRTIAVGTPARPIRKWCAESRSWLPFQPPAASGGSLVSVGSDSSS